MCKIMNVDKALLNRKQLYELFCEISEIVLQECLSKYLLYFLMKTFKCEYHLTYIVKMYYLLTKTKNPAYA